MRRKRNDRRYAYWHPIAESYRAYYQNGESKDKNAYYDNHHNPCDYCENSIAYSPALLIFLVKSAFSLSKPDRHLFCKPCLSLEMI